MQTAEVCDPTVFKKDTMTVSKWRSTLKKPFSKTEEAYVKLPKNKLVTY